MNIAQRQFLPASWASPLHADGVGDATAAKNVSTGRGCLLLHRVHADCTFQFDLIKVTEVLAGRCLSYLDHIRTAKLNNLKICFIQLNQ